MYAYARDLRTALQNAPGFAQVVLAMHCAEPHAEIDVFAHSLGARVVAGAVKWAARMHKSLHVKRAVLAAPDVSPLDYAALMNDSESLGNTTVYTAKEDRPLFLSMLIHLHDRLGQTRVDRLALPRTRFIDVSREDHSFFGHGYVWIR